MVLRDEQLERIALRMDGAQADLTAQERAVEEEFRADEAAFGAALDVTVPREAMDRARRRMLAELAREEHKTRWLRYASGAAAVAAAVLLAVGVGWKPAPPKRQQAPVGSASLAPKTEMENGKAWQPGRNIDLELIAQVVDELEGDIAVLPARPSTVEFRTEMLLEEIDELWVDSLIALPLDG